MNKNGVLVINMPPENKFTSNQRNSFRSACNRWQCDFIEFVKGWEPYPPTSFKLKAFDICPHDRILIMDSDMIIRSDAPNPFTFTNPEYFYAVRNQQPHHIDFYREINVEIARENINRILTQKFIQNKISVELISNTFFNGGFLMISRQYHEEIFVLANYLMLGVEQVNWHDQIPLNIAAHTILGGYHDLGYEWNYQFPTDLNKMTSYVYHFAGHDNKYEILKKVNWKLEKEG